MRVVFDTNVVLSALMFPSGSLAWLRDAWHDGSLVPLVSDQTAAELIRALSYPKFGLSEEDVFSLLEDYLPFAEIVEVGSVETGVVCRDPDDQKFLTLGLFAGADALVTGDQDLLCVGEQPAFPVLTAAELAARL